MPSSRTPGEGGPSQYGRAIREAGPLFGSGIQMAVAVVMMFFAGRWLDEIMGTAPWLMLSGILLGATAGLVHFIRTVMALDRNQRKDGGNRTPGSSV